MSQVGGCYIWCRGMEKFVPIFACLVASFDVRAMNVSERKEGFLMFWVEFGRIWDFLDLVEYFCWELKLLGFSLFCGR